jgi:hypothetical protein
MDTIIRSELDNQITQPRNKGKLTGAKPPLRPKHVWAVRTRLQLANRFRDLALFDLAIDSKLRGCDVVALQVVDVAPTGVRSIGIRSPAQNRNPFASRSRSKRAKRSMIIFPTTWSIRYIPLYGRGPARSDHAAVRKTVS